MIDLKLFVDLQGDTPASLLLKPSSPGYLQFFVISFSVNYSIVVTGECEGELPSANPMSFDVVLSTVAPLLSKNYKFRLSYFDNTLRFDEVDGRFSVTPLCVEHVNDMALDIAQRYMDFFVTLSSFEERREELEEAEYELAQLNGSYQQAKVTELSGFPNDSNPFGKADATTREQHIDDYFKPRIAEIENRIADIRDGIPEITLVDMESFRRISAIAARSGSTVAMCDDYAVVDLTTAFAIQKVKCGSRSIQGKLLRQLLMLKNGRFFEYRGDLIFVGFTGKGKDGSSTVVFLNSYLPNTAVDSSIVTKGVVKEKYKLKLKGMLQVVTAVSGKFDTMVFDMGSSVLRLSNDRGEMLSYKFEVEDAKTIELNKMLRGEHAGAIVMSSIEVPKVVQRLLPLMENDFVIYVKERKVVLQSGSLYVVFSK